MTGYAQPQGIFFVCPMYNTAADGISTLALPAPAIIREGASAAKFMLSTTGITVSADTIIVAVSTHDIQKGLLHGSPKN